MDPMGALGTLGFYLALILMVQAWAQHMALTILDRVESIVENATITIPTDYFNATQYKKAINDYLDWLGNLTNSEDLRQSIERLRRSINEALDQLNESLTTVNATIRP